METNYYTIKVDGESRRQTRTTTGRRRPADAHLDRLVHSTVDPNDPTYLHYAHEHIQMEFLRAARAATPNPRVLVIGGGGYTFPRYAIEVLPETRMDVVEIDPGVTHVAYEYLGLKHDYKGSTIIHMDGRQFVAEKAAPGSYDLVMQDAVNDLSVPSHLLTKEYNDAVKRALKPDGVYLLTVIDAIEYGKLWKAAVHTLGKTYPAETSACSSPRDVQTWSRQVYVIYASDRPADMTALEHAVRKQLHSLEPAAGAAATFAGPAAAAAWRGAARDRLRGRRPRRGQERGPVLHAASAARDAQAVPRRRTADHPHRPVRPDRQPDGRRLPLPRRQGRVSRLRRCNRPAGGDDGAVPSSPGDPPCPAPTAPTAANCSPPSAAPRRRGRLAAAQKPAEPRKKYAFKKSINLWAFPYPERMTLEQCLQLAKDAGFDGIELNYDLDNDLSPKSGAEGVRGDPQDGRGDRHRHQRPVLVPVLAVPADRATTPPSARRGLELAGKMAEAAHDLGTENLLVVPGAVHIPWRTDHEPVPNDVCDKRAREAVAQAAAAGREAEAST